MVAAKEMVTKGVKSLSTAHRVVVSKFFSREADRGNGVCILGQGDMHVWGGGSGVGSGRGGTEQH